MDLLMWIYGYAFAGTYRRAEWWKPPSQGCIFCNSHPRELRIAAQGAQFRYITIPYFCIITCLYISQRTNSNYVLLCVVKIAEQEQKHLNKVGSVCDVLCVTVQCMGQKLWC